MNATLASPQLRLPDEILVPKTSAAQPRYMVQLDALRAFAVMAVMFNHFYGAKHGGVLPWGEWGVQLFFVLSGFLITGILLNCRDLGDQAGTRQGRTHQLRQFYVRRFLRIVPLFYTVVLLAALANIRPARETLFWHLTYTSNIHMALQAGWDGPLSHFWSLAVEEQFYLLWPALILFLPDRFLLPGIILAIVIAPVYRISGSLFGLNEIAISALMFGSLDFLGIGALLALFRYKRPRQFAATARLKGYNWLGFATLCVVIIAALLVSRNGLIPIIGALFAPLFFAWLIHKTALGFTGQTGRLMQWKPLIYLGQISYGLYIFHKFLTTIVPRGFEALHLSYPENSIVQLVLLITINIVLASISWFILERPINRLKRRFDYAG